METFRQWLYTGPGHFQLEEVEKEEPKPGMVRLEVKAFSICGSDLTAFRRMHERMVPPLVLGHEFCGVVDAVGEGVATVKVGQRVAVNPILRCGACWHCKNGRPNLCPNRHNTGTTILAGRYDGGMREFTYMPEFSLMPLPDSIDFIHGALIEPLGVCIHMADVGYLPNEKYTVIYGCGPVGLMTMLILKARGVEHVICVDVRKNRLKLAKELGASLTIHATEDDTVSLVRQFAKERGGADRILLCTDAPEPFLEAIKLARMDGSIVLTGHIKPTIAFRPEDILEKGLRILSQVTFLPEHLERSMEMIQNKEIPLDKIITKVLPFSSLQDACELLCAPDNDEIKIVIDVTRK